MSKELIIVERQDRILTLSINRPGQRNSLTPELLSRLSEILTQLRDESEIRVVVIRGVGEQAFSSGYDIGGIPTGGTREEVEAQRSHLDRCFDSIMAAPFPVIAMVYGYAVGAGLELAITCDLRVAADTARFGITPARLGVGYHTAGIRKLMNLVGISSTKEFFFTGKLIEANRAKEIGLVDHVVTAQELPAATYDLAHEIASNASLAIAVIKFAISKLASFPKLEDHDEADIELLHMRALQSEDAKEGQRAFLEKRKPKFTGR